MASTIDFVEYVCDCIAGCGHIRYRKMFGEYLVYVDDKPIFLVCDNQVFVKDFPLLKSVLVNVSMASPYPGAKMHYLLDADDRDMLRLVVVTILPIVPVKISKR
ncbi:MAG: transcriptional regulator [Bacteroidetes bacterium]|uniref:Transcriptional regulator n=1 Tax=Candidatus Gallipaludibacter merdavium TaxID=2840839 RepID=A0A9D9HUB7_9BACT|nr:transcriptional regulator [Candidatus Gallipaludibacter merdavium]